MSRKWVVLWVSLNLCTAPALLWISHEQRLWLVCWQQVERRHHRLAIRREQLLLEQAAVGAHSRIEKVAREALQMHYPALNEQERLDCCG